MRPPRDILLGLGFGGLPDEYSNNDRIRVGLGGDGSENNLDDLVQELTRAAEAYLGIGQD